MPNGQHEAGKHSKAGKKRAAQSPRLPKNPANQKVTPEAPAKGTVYQSKSTKPGIIGKLFKGK
jgi:hypothetical protein